MVALEFARRSPELRVLLLDYGAPGAPSRNALDDQIGVRNPINHHAPYECTNKGLGGSSASWGGRCVMYDRADFLPRPVIGDGCTWDVSFYKECLPYVAATQRYFESGSGPFDLGDGEETVPPLAEGFRSALVSDTVVERWSLPTRFGSQYEGELKVLPNLDLLLGVEARTLLQPDSSGRLPGLTLREVATGEETKAEAEALVLATGAQETTRLLLRNPHVFARLPAPPEALGRYYQGHISGKIASVCFNGNPRATEYGFRRESDGSYQRRRFQFTDQTLVCRNLLNTAFWLDNPLYYDPTHRSGAMSFMYLAMLIPILGKRLAPPAVAHSITKGKVNRVGAHFWNIICGLPGSLVTPASIFYRRYLLRRKLPGVFLFSGDNRYALHFHSEQIPASENRMELTDDGPMMVIHYRVTEADAAGVIRAHEVLDAELQACGAGRLKYWFPLEDRLAAIMAMSKDGVHQSGTTRIANDPTQGVVNRDLCVWGTSNLYVCSSSVFPTSGQANPTFFLGVCALRLAHHLADHAHR
jgi:choline dehydrogenase-like flavoprotein